MCAEECRAVMQSIVLLIVLLCFQVGLDYLPRRRLKVNFAAQDGHMSRSVGRFCPIVPAKSPRTFSGPWGHSVGVLKKHWARCPCGPSVWCCRRWPTCAKQVASSTDMQPFPDSCRKMKEPGNEVPRELSYW